MPRFKPVPLALSALLLAAAPAAAQEPDDLGDLLKKNLTLEQEVTTATRSARKAGLAPASVVVVTDEDIAVRGYTDIEQVLHDLPGFDFARGYGDEWSTIYMRGYRSSNSDHFVFMVDGIIENDLWKSNAYIGPQYPLSDVKRIEVTYGPASALYGPNASQGIIHVITKSGEELAGGQTYAGVGSLGTAFVDTTIGTVAGGTDLTVTARGFSQAGRTDVGRFPDFDYADARPGYTAIAPGFANYKRDGALRFKLGHGGWTFGGSTWRREDAPGFWYNDRAAAVNNGANWTPVMSHVYGRYRGRLADNVTWASLLQYRNHKIDGGSLGVDWDETSQNWVRTYFSTVSKEFWANQQLEVNLLPGLDVIGGLDLANGDFQGNYVTGTQSFPEESGRVSQAPGEPPLPGAGNVYDITRAAAYGQGTWTPIDPLQFTIGARYDYRILRNQPAYGGLGGVFSPRLGAVWAPNDTWTLKALYATGFIDPDNFTAFSTAPGRTLRAVDLRPEKLQSGEVAIGQKLSETLQHEVAGYLNDYDDTFGQLQVPDPARPGQTTGQNRNFGGRTIKGAEYRLNWTPWPGVKTWANYTFADPQNDPGQPVTGDIAAHKGNLGASTRLGDWRGSLRANLVGARPTIDSNPVKVIAPYAVLNASLGKTNLGLAGVSADLIVNNLLDAEYYDPGVRTATGIYASQLPQNGRTVMVRLGYEF